MTYFPSPNSPAVITSQGVQEIPGGASSRHGSAAPVVVVVSAPPPAVYVAPAPLPGRVMVPRAQPLVRPSPHVPLSQQSAGAPTLAGRVVRGGVPLSQQGHGPVRR